MLRCPSCRTDDPQCLSVDVTLGGYFANDLIHDCVDLPEIRRYLRDSLQPTESQLECSACGYRGSWDDRQEDA